MSEYKNLYLRCANIIQRCDRWLGSDNELFRGCKLLSDTTARPITASRKQAIRSADIANLAGDCYPSQFLDFKSDVDDFITHTHSSTVNQWNVFNAANLGEYGSSVNTLFTVAELLQSVSGRLQLAFHNLEDAIQTGGYGLGGLEINDDWQTVLTEQYNDDWFSRMTTNTNLYLNLLYEKGYGIGKSSFRELRDGLNREWIVVQSKMPETTEDDIARRYHELEPTVGRGKQKRYDALQPMFEAAGIEHPDNHVDSRLKSILSTASKNGIKRLPKQK